MNNKRLIILLCVLSYAAAGCYKSGSRKSKATDTETASDSDFQTDSASATETDTVTDADTATAVVFDSESLGTDDSDTDAVGTDSDTKHVDTASDGIPETDSDSGHETDSNSDGPPPETDSRHETDSNSDGTPPETDSGDETDSHSDSTPPEETDTADSCEGTGVWRDPATALCWQAAPPPEVLRFEDARAYCESLTLGKQNTWALPTIEELRSLIRDCPATEVGGDCTPTSPDEQDSDCQGCGPIPETAQLPCYWESVLGSDCDTPYWSSDLAHYPFEPRSYYAWIVDFHTAAVLDDWVGMLPYIESDGGVVDPPSNSNKVRCVANPVK